MVSIEPQSTNDTSSSSIIQSRALIDAAGRGQLERVRSILQESPSLVNARGTLDITPLMSTIHHSLTNHHVCMHYHTWHVGCTA